MTSSNNQDDLEFSYKKYRIGNPDDFKTEDLRINKTNDQVRQEQEAAGITRKRFLDTDDKIQKRDLPTFGVTYGKSQGKGYTPAPQNAKSGPTMDNVIAGAEISKAVSSKDQIFFDSRGRAYKLLNDSEKELAEKESISQALERLEVSDEISGAENDTFSEYAIAFLKCHNQYRAQHQVPNLKLSKKLCQKAQEWADHLLKTGSLARSDNDFRDLGVNENIYGMNSNNPNLTISAEQVAEHWYSEVKNYKFEDSDFEIYRNFQNIGHFSQMVWKNTVTLGVGHAAGDGKVFVVAHYFPAGNIGMRFRDNVFPIKK